LKRAIISDIHGNLEALGAVLARIDDCRVDGLICLGDLIGYGPDSIQCLRIASQWPVVIAGDWDGSLVKHDPTQWSPTINRHIEWIRKQLSLASDADDLVAAARQFKTVHEQFGCIFTHGTPSNVRDFVFPEDIYSPKKLDRIASEFDSVIFVGHTHIPGLFIRNDGNWTYLETTDGHQCDITNYDKLICNVGSVGQPRDGDSRASFVLFDGRTITFHRVEYDLWTTIAKIEAIPEIDNIQGQRLAEGR
jgi:predicted phosphodiesterase